MLSFRVSGFRFRVDRNRNSEPANHLKTFRVSDLEFAFTQKLGATPPPYACVSLELSPLNTEVYRERSLAVSRTSAPPW